MNIKNNSDNTKLILSIIVRGGAKNGKIRA